MIAIQGAVPRMPEFRFKSPVNWKLSPGQHWAVIGRNGAGKTLFCDILTGKLPLKEGEVSIAPPYCYPGAIKSIAFKNIYDLADYKSMYYQQRWNSTEAENAPLVSELVKNWDNQDEMHQLLRFFHAEDLLPKRIILLSSGELRKFLLIKALLSKPAVLIIDNPYIGLDAPSRELLNELLQRMSEIGSLQIVLVLSNPDDIPPVISHVLPIEEMELLPSYALGNDRKVREDICWEEKPEEIELPEGTDKNALSYTYALKMEAIHVRYGDRIILNDLSWDVKKGERWALLGPNGAGKSTLLSLVCADNPQSYANRFSLFDRKRGSGESIWDIKRRIGYISPEVHLFYLEDVPAIQVVGSGFFDSIGLYRKCNEQQEAEALKWMTTFGIEHLQSRSFLKLSYGEQRLVLLARALVKSPELLVLDEPLHGLDKRNKLRVKAIIEKYCNQRGNTLIYVTHYLHEIPECVDRKLVLVKQS